MTTHKISIYVTTDDETALALAQDLEEHARDFGLGEVNGQITGMKVKRLVVPLLNEHFAVPV